MAVVSRRTWNGCANGARLCATTRTEARKRQHGGTTEFGRFDKSKRRLDILALDREGTLVVAELKLDTSSSLADLQAVRYAAFCSTMQPADMVRELAAYEGLSQEDAEARVLEFMEAEELPDLDG